MNDCEKKFVEKVKAEIEMKGELQQAVANVTDDNVEVIRKKIESSLELKDFFIKNVKCIAFARYRNAENIAKLAKLYDIKIDVPGSYRDISDRLADEIGVVACIRSDDFEKLREFSTQPNFSFNKAPDTDYQFSLIDYAAAFGAVKCYKFCFLNNSHYGESFANFAILGGSLEIIRHSVNQGIVYNKCLLNADRLLRPEISEWICNTYDDIELQDWEVHQGLNCLSAIPFYGSRMLSICSINFLFLGMHDEAKAMILMGGTDEVFVSEKSIVMVAAMMNDVKMLEFLKSKNFNMRLTTQQWYVDPLIVAAEYGAEDAFFYLAPNYDNPNIETYCDKTRAVEIPLLSRPCAKHHCPKTGYFSNIRSMDE